MPGRSYTSFHVCGAAYVKFRRHVCTIPHIQDIAMMAYIECYCIGWFYFQGFNIKSNYFYSKLQTWSLVVWSGHGPDLRECWQLLVSNPQVENVHKFVTSAQWISFCQHLSELNGAVGGHPLVTGVSCCFETCEKSRWMPIYGSHCLTLKKRMEVTTSSTKQLSQTMSQRFPEVNLAKDNLVFGWLISMESTNSFDGLLFGFP